MRRSCRGSAQAENEHHHPSRTRKRDSVRKRKPKGSLLRRTLSGFFVPTSRQTRSWKLLPLEGLTSGEGIDAGKGYWEEKHRRLDKRLNRPAPGDPRYVVRPKADRDSTIKPITTPPKEALNSATGSWLPLTRRSLFSQASPKWDGTRG